MAPTPTTPIDPAAEAKAMADLFYDASEAVDNFSTSFNPPLPDDQMARLEVESGALEDRAHFFTAQAIGDVLQTLQPDLANIKQVTAQATVQLGVLKDIDEGINIATSLLSLGTAIAAKDPATILAATQALANLVAA